MATTRDERKIRILIVDDHPIVRDGLALMMSGQPDLEVCGQAGNATDAMAQAGILCPDVALVDVFLEGSNGIELTKTLVSRHADLKVLVLSMHDEDVYAERAIRAGAHGYVMKQQASRTILDAIRAVVAGKEFVSERVAERLRSSGRRPHRQLPIEKLSDRELEVFELLGHGLDRHEVAERLHISVKTVEAHRAGIRGKLGLDSSAEILRQALMWVELRRQKPTP